MTPSQKILRFRPACAKVGICRSTIYELIKADKFPHPIRLSARSVGFLESELDAWLEKKASERT